jgi:hypothetical protein
VSGCGGSTTGPVEVSVPTPAPTGNAAARCAALHAALPATVGDQTRRATHPNSPLLAAWGPHPIVLRCGTPLPALLTPGNKNYDPESDAEWINGLSWLVEQRSGSYRFTTLDRAVRVEVTVPDDFNPRRSGEPQTDPLIDVTSAILRTIPNQDGQFKQDVSPLPLPTDTP